MMPKYQEYRDLTAKINNKATELQYYRDYSVELKETAAKLESYKEAVSKIEDFLPTEFSIPVFYANIQNMSSQSGMILTNIKESGIVLKEGGIKERFYGVSVVGSYSNFQNFLSVLQKSAKLIEVEKFSFTSEMVGGEGEGEEFTLGIKTYSY